MFRFAAFALRTAQVLPVSVLTPECNQNARKKCKLSHEGCREFARKLYNESEGDKYKIFIVGNAGTGNAKIGIIKNPARLWKEGKLCAHPVHFKL